MPGWAIILLWVCLGILTARVISWVSRDRGDAISNFAIVCVWPVIWAFGVVILIIMGIDWLVNVGFSAHGDDR